MKIRQLISWLAGGTTLLIAFTGTDFTLGGDWAGLDELMDEFPNLPQSIQDIFSEAVNKHETAVDNPEKKEDFAEALGKYLELTSVQLPDRGAVDLLHCSKTITYNVWKLCQKCGEDELANYYEACYEALTTLHGT